MAKTMAKTKIGFIGLGHMGNPMVMNLLAQGHQVHVYDIVTASMSSLVAKGAIAAYSPAEVAKDAEFVFTMLQSGEQVSDACLGAQGIFTHFAENALYIDCSSIALITSRLLHQEARARGIAMLDAPVSGGVKGAKAATLTIMVGGDTAHFQRAEPLLAHLGKLIFHAGAAGNGQVAKICNNMILGISMIAISEAFTLAQGLGLDAQTFYEISSHASGECWAMTHYCPVPGILADVPAAHDYQPGFTANMMLKDLKLSQSAAQSIHLETTLGAQATALYQHFAEMGYADLDFSAIIKQIQAHKTTA